MPTRIEFNVATGQSTTLNLTPSEIDAAQAATAAAQAAAALIPNPIGFIMAAKTIFGGPVAILNYPVSLQNAISYCLQAIELGQWQDAHDIIAAFQTQIALANATAYPNLKAAVATYNLPIPPLP